MDYSKHDSATVYVEAMTGPGVVGAELAAAGVFMPSLQDPKLLAVIEKVVGNDRDSFVARLAELQPHLLDLGEDALSICERMPR